MFFWDYGFFGFCSSLRTELTLSIAVLKQQIMSLATAPSLWKTEGKKEICYNSGDSPLLSLDCDTTEEYDVHVYNDQGQAIQWFAQIPWQA